MPMVVAINLVAGKLTVMLRLPIYLDSIGTVLMGALCGPIPAAVAGVASNCLMALTGDVIFLLFLPASAAVGILSGALSLQGFFSRPYLAILAGAMTGVVAAAVSAPISAYALGGVTGGGTDLLVAYFRSTGRTALEASFAQCLVSDPLDKMVSFLLVQTILAALPGRLRSGFPMGPRLIDLRGLSLISVSPRGGHPQRRTGQRLAPTSTTLYLGRAGWLHGRSPLTKLLLLAVVVGAAVTAPGVLLGPEGTVFEVWLPLLVTGVLALAMMSGVGLELGRRVMLVWLPLLVSLLVIQGLFGPGPGVVCWWGSYSLRGLTGAFVLALRILAILEGVMLVLLTTRPGHLAGDLERLGFPPAFTYVVLAAWQFIPTMAARITDVLDAQAARALPTEGGLWHRFRVLLPVAGPVLLGTLAQVEERALALEARGFGSHRRRTWLSDPPGGTLDRVLQLLLGACLILNLWWVLER